jgi:hypothetical protein
MHTAFENSLEAFIRNCAGTVVHVFGDWNSRNEEHPRCYIEAEDGEKAIKENCIGEAMRAVQYITSLHAFGLWPGDSHGAPYRALAASIDIARRIAMTHMNDKTTTCDMKLSSNCDSCPSQWGKIIHDRVDNFELENIYGICLTCLKAAATDEQHANLAQRCLKHTQIYSKRGWPYYAMFSPE